MNVEFCKWAEDNGWKISRSDKKLPPEILERYKDIPMEWLQFIDGMGKITNEDGTVWFLTADNYYPKGEDEFRYNEYELISIGAAEDDEDWKGDIIAFWDNHLPIVMSVRDGYEYCAIELDSGKVVSGFEPEFEEPETLADSFGEFLELFMEGEIYD